MARTINGHHVFGEAITVAAYSAEEAKDLIRKKTSRQIWEVLELDCGKWSVYVAKPEDCFACND